MEGDRRLQLILITVATVIFALSYIIGYMVGKEAGFEEAKAKFEVEKQRLLKTLAEISPISRPVENKLVNESEETETENAEKGEKEAEEETTPAPEEATQAQKQEENNPIETQVPTESTEGNFYLQVGVFRNATNASKLAEKLREGGYEATVVPTASGKYSKVIVGYFSSKEEALKVKEELKSEGYNSILKRRQP